MAPEEPRETADGSAGNPRQRRDLASALGSDRFIVAPSRSRFHCRGDLPVPTFCLHVNCARRPAPDQVVPIELRPQPLKPPAVPMGTFPPRYTQCALFPPKRTMINPSALSSVRSFLLTRNQPRSKVIIGKTMITPAPD